jgi:hypothetical protein
MMDILESWVGRSVHVEVLSGLGSREVGPAQRPGYKLGVAEADGLLEEVGERGIILREDRGSDLFFSWNAVLMIQAHRKDDGW